MIKIMLSDLLGKHKMTQKALSEETGIRPGTISKMYYEEVKRIDINHLNSICRVFGCGISDLLKYVSDDDIYTPRGDSRKITDVKQITTDIPNEAGIKIELNNIKD